MKQDRQPRIPRANLQQDAILTVTNGTSTGGAVSDIEPTDDCSTATADGTTAVGSPTAATTSLSSIVATQTGGPRPPPWRPHHLGAEFAEALRLAGRRKVLKAPGKLLLLRSRPLSESARVPKRRMALVKRQAKKRNSDLISWHNVCSRGGSLTLSAESESERPQRPELLRRKQRRPQCDDLSVSTTDSDASTDALRKPSKRPQRPKSPEAALPHLLAAVQVIVSELSQQGHLPKDPAPQLTEADLREAIELLLQKRSTVLKQTRPVLNKPVVTGQREIEMDASGDGPFRLTVCIPGDTLGSTRSETVQATAPIGDVPAENTVNYVKDIDAGIALPGVELCRDSSSGNAAAAAVAAAVAQASVLEKCTKAEPDPVGHMERCSMDEDLINSFHRELAEQFKLGSETNAVMRASLNSIQSFEGRRSSLLQHTTADDLLRMLDDEDASQDRSTIISSTFGINEASDSASTIPQQQHKNPRKRSTKRLNVQQVQVGYADSEASQKRVDEDSEDIDMEHKALVERRKEMREHLRRVRAPLVSCPAGVVGHLAGHTEQADLAKFLLDRMLPAGLIGRSALDVRNLLTVLRLSQPPLRRGQYQRSTNASPDIQSHQSSGSAT